MAYLDRMSGRGYRRIASFLAPATAVLLALGPEPVAAAPVRDPLDVHGLELADGRTVAPAPAAVWGAGSGIDPRVADRGLVRLRSEVGPVWVAWSAARRSASGIMLSNVKAPGTVASPARAEAFALAFLERHLAVLAPGSSIGDFEVVGNDLSSGNRTVGLQQRHRGLPVLGGQIGVRFAADRLVLVTSQARPDVTVPTRTTPTVTPARARAEARAFVARDFDPEGAGSDSSGGPLGSSPAASKAFTVSGPDEGPLVLVETKRDLKNLQLPF